MFTLFTYCLTASCQGLKAITLYILFICIGYFHAGGQFLVPVIPSWSNTEVWVCFLKVTVTGWFQNDPALTQVNAWQGLLTSVPISRPGTCFLLPGGWPVPGGNLSDFLSGSALCPAWMLSGRDHSCSWDRIFQRCHSPFRPQVFPGWHCHHYLCLIQCQRNTSQKSCQ